MTGINDHIGNVVNRTKKFFSSDGPGHFLVGTSFPVESPGMPPLNSLNLQRELTRWLDASLENARPGWESKRGLDDDTIPNICPRFGIAEHTAWLGVDVHLQEDTSLPVPSLATCSDFSSLSLSENNPWYRYMKEGYDYLRSRNDGTFVLSVRGTMAPMDIANALRGNELFTDFFVDPDGVHSLLAFLQKAVEWYYPRLRSWADEIHDGQVYCFAGSWMGNNCFGHSSNDAAHMCSPDIYEQFGFPYENALTEKYGCAMYHTHNQQMGHIPQLAQLSGLSLLEITHDPNTPPLIEDLPRLFESSGNVNIMIRATSDAIRKHIEELKSRNVFLLANCADRKDAEDIVGFVRSHSCMKTK